MKPKILYFSPNPDDACSFYRGIGPLVRLPDCEVVRLPDRISWSALMGGDIGFMMRPYNEKHLSIAKLINDQMPLWLDFDDDLFHVPPDNPSYTTYIDPKVRNTLEEILCMASVISVTTRELAKVYGEFNPNIHVIENAYNNFAFPESMSDEPRDKIVLWRGSDAHRLDLLTYAGEIIEVASQHPDWKFVFMGSVPWQVGEHINVTYIPPMEIFRYMKFIRESSRAAVHMVPLADNLFNRGKSNIAWIEAASAGSAVLAPNFPSWEKPGITCYDSRTDFAQQLTTLMQHTDSEKAAASWQFISDNLLLSDINRRRTALIQHALS